MWFVRNIKRVVPLVSAAMVVGCIPHDGARDSRYLAPPQDLPPRYLPEEQAPVPIVPSRPVWEARPVTPDARDVAAAEYTVSPGQTLRSIANSSGAGSEAIARANGLQPPFVIFAGQRLIIPAGRYHLVRQGETGIAIARAFGVPWSRIVADNELVDPYILRAGQRILIPRAGPMTPAERAAAFHLDIDDIVTGSEPALASNQRPVEPSRSASRILPPDAYVAEPLRRTGSFAWPVNGNVIGRFGPISPGERNNGVKIAVPINTPVLAAADGVVAYTGEGVAGMGGLVMLKHGEGWKTVYAHTRQILVQRGQGVKRGQTIALSGDSGYAKSPQLHFEIRNGRTPVDPLGQLPRR